MDDRLQKALDFSNYSLTISNQKKNLKNRLNQMLLVHHNNGLFVADPTTINFVCHLSSTQDSAVFLDTKENPIRVSDLLAFKVKLENAYDDAMREYEAEFNKIKKLRNLNKLLED
jgi:hypothetical protein|tara:strand:- start:1137 stop:1481 length:345 start_codon:yes stop_codon:yes gene_type:complete